MPPQSRSASPGRTPTPRTAWRLAMLLTSFCKSVIIVRLQAARAAFATQLDGRLDRGKFYGTVRRDCSSAPDFASGNDGCSGCSIHQKSEALGNVNNGAKKMHTQIFFIPLAIGLACAAPGSGLTSSAYAITLAASNESKCRTPDECQACKSQCENNSVQDLRNCDLKNRIGLPRNLECRDHVYDLRAECFSRC